MYNNKHLNKYPAMKPWVGSDYSSLNHKRLLIIGESHYLPPESMKPSNPDEWYSGSQRNLSEEEKEWISTSGIIKNNWERNFPKKAHGIYRNFARELNHSSYRFSNPSEIVNKIAFMNFFQRPAETTGESIKVHKQDIEVSKGVLSAVIKSLQPNLIIFTSSKAGRHGVELVRKHNISVAVTPHPTSQWWNRESKKYAGYGRDVITKFILNHKWYKAPRHNDSR